jgi:hypothetical protein
MRAASRTIGRSEENREVFHHPDDETAATSYDRVGGEGGESLSANAIIASIRVFDHKFGGWRGLWSNYVCKQRCRHRRLRPARLCWWQIPRNSPAIVNLSM